MRSPSRCAPPRTSESIPPVPAANQPPRVQLLPEPPRPPRMSEPMPTVPPANQPPRQQLLPEPLRPVPTVPTVPPVSAMPPVPLGPMAAGVAGAIGALAASGTPMSEFSADEEQTAVDDAKLKLAAHHDVHVGEHTKPASEDLRNLLEDQLFLSAELDAFCSNHFPAIAKQFKQGMSRTDRTNLLLAGAEPAAIMDRLKEWDVSLERRQEVVAAVVAGSSQLMVAPTVPPGPPAPPVTSAGPPPAPKTTSPQPIAALAETPSEPAIPAIPAHPPKPPTPPPTPPTPPAASAAESPPAARTPVPESPPAFREPTAVLSVGVGLVLANRYFLTSEVGHGAVAMVWNAYDRIKDEQVALKLLHGAAAENPVLVQRFWQSAQQQASLSHPAIVGVLNKPREESGIHYVVMEYVPAGNLRNWVLNNKLTRTQLLRLMQRLGSALQYAHERKVLHRNIKPTNILFDTTGHARLVDFGLQWPADATTEKQSRLDRVIYMAPEEQLGDSDGDPRSDVYSLGMCALFALHGKELPSLVMQERAAFIEQLEVPPALKAVVKRAVAMNAADRFSSAAEFCRALEVDAPALPGISVRNSDARGPERRSSAEDLRTIKSEPSQRMQIPALTTSMPPPSVGGSPPPPPIPAAARPPAPPPPPPAALVSGPTPAVAPPTPPPALPPPRPRPLLRDLEEVPPAPGRNPTAAAQYVITTEKVPVVLAAPVIARTSTPAVVPMLAPAPQKAGPWCSLAFATLGLLVISGGVLAYLFGTMPGASPGGALVVNQDRDSSGNPVTAGSTDRPVAEALNDPTTKVPPLTAPVIPLHGPDKSKTVAGTTRTDTSKPVGKPDSGTKVAMVGPKEAARIPGHSEPATSAGKPENKAEGKTEPGTPSKTPAITKVAKVDPGVATAHPGPNVPAGTKPVVGPGPTVIARTNIPATPAVKPQAGTPVVSLMPPTPPVKPVGPATRPPSIPIIAAKQPPKTWEVVALNDTGHKAEPPHTMAAPPPPRPVTSPPPSTANSEDEATLRDAQAAFVRGDRQGAISAALKVTPHGGEEAIKAWRFVGGAACSGKLATQASSAYRNLKDPDHKRLLVELCQRNGLHFADGAFSVPEE